MVVVQAKFCDYPDPFISFHNVHMENVLAVAPNRDRVAAMVTARRAGLMDLVQFKEQVHELNDEELAELLLAITAYSQQWSWRADEVD